MQVTIFSFLSALLWSSLLIVAIYLLRHTRFKQHFGVLSMVLLYLFCAVRLFLPLEFPHTLIAADGVIYPHIYNLLTRERDMLANKPLVLILCAAWLLGFCELLFRYIRQYRKAIYSVARYTTPWNERTNALLEQVRRQTGRKLRVQGCTARNIESAFGMGVLHKRIILPDRDYTETELHYVLLHEYTHFLNHDTVVKLLVTLFCMMFWWNPVVYLLQKDLEQTLEIKCDLSVARTLDEQERAAYLRTILFLDEADRAQAPLAVYGNRAVPSGRTNRDQGTVRYGYDLLGTAAPPHRQRHAYRRVRPAADRVLRGFAAAEVRSTEQQRTPSR